MTVEERLLARGIEPTKRAVAAYFFTQRLADGIIADLEAGAKGSKTDGDKTDGDS